MDFEPIGFFRGDAARRYEAPRQGVFDGGRGVVELEPKRGYEMALRDLEGFERIWLIFAFDRNGGRWRPTTRPPVMAPGHRRVGLFATRAPYRPNPIGLSCVRLINVTGLAIHVAEADLLDGTPILDLKPYVPAADSFPDARAGWVENQADDTWEVKASPEFLSACATVQSAGAPDVHRAAVLQLSHAPFDTTHKRVRKTDGGGILSLRMFRIVFTADPVTHSITLVRLDSGYTPSELAADGDPYEDKAFHRALLGIKFGGSPIFRA